MDKEICNGCGKLRYLDDGYCAQCLQKLANKSRKEDLQDDEALEMSSAGVHEFDPEEDDEACSDAFEKMQNHLDDSNDATDDEEDL